MSKRKNKEKATSKHVLSYQPGLQRESHPSFYRYLDVICKQNHY